MKQKDLIKILKALSDNNRLKVLRIIAKKGEISCQELQKYFQLSQPTLSHHFNKLIETDIISYRKEGTKHIYKLNQEILSKIGIDTQTLITNIKE